MAPQPRPAPAEREILDGFATVRLLLRRSVMSRSTPSALACALACACLAMLGLPDAVSAQDEEGDLVEDGASEAPARPELPEGIHPLIRSERGEPLVVVRVVTEPSWSRGALHLRRREWPTVVERAVDRRALPSQVRADLGRVWTLSSHTAVVCSARLGTPRVVRRISPEFQYDTWSGEEGGHRFTDAEVAAAAWDLAEGYELLVAPVRKLHGHCQGAGWATAEVPRFGHGAVGNATRVLAAFRTLPAYAELAESWTEARQYDLDPAAEHWDERSGGAARTIVEFDAGGRRFTLVVASAHDGCGDFVGELWALYEHLGPRDAPAQESLSLVASERTYDFAPTALVDLDGDDVPELLGAGRLHAVRTGASADVAPLFTGCPC